MTFLEIVRAAALESGTMGNSGTNPATLTGVTGRGLVFKRLAAAAWEEVQTERNDWRWMRTEFTSTNLLSSTSTYSPQDILGSDVRFREWVPFHEDYRTFSIWTTADGQDTEGDLEYVDWPIWRQRYTRGVQPDNAKPSCFTIDDQNNLRFAPTPNAACTLRGMYRKSPQTLAADGDIPECPAEFHRLIVFRTLLKVINYDDGSPQFQWWMMESDRLFGALVQDQTTMPYFGRRSRTIWF